MSSAFTVPCWHSDTHPDKLNHCICTTIPSSHSSHQRSTVVINRHLRVVVQAATAAEKHCPRCRLVKPSTDFNRDASNADGLRSYCKPCTSER